MFRRSLKHDSDSSDDFDSAVEDVCSSSNETANDVAGIGTSSTDYSRCGIRPSFSNKPKSVDNATPLRDQGDLAFRESVSLSDATTSSAAVAAHPKASTSDQEPGQGDCFRFKDLDTGKVYILDKRNCIFDRDTGNVYAVNENSLEVPNEAAGVKDLSSGKMISFGEFERQASLGRSEADKHRRSSSNETNDVGSEGDGSSRPAPLAKRVKAKLKASAKLFHQRSPMSPASPTSSHWSLGERHSISKQSMSEVTGREDSNASATGSGIPVKVNTHKKMVKELTQMHLVQELKAHTGVIWTMKFSRNGRYLATSGQDCQVVVWEVVRNSKPASGDLDKAMSNMQVSAVQGVEAASGNVPPSGTAADEVHAGETAASSAGCSVFECDYPLLSSTPFRRYSGHKQDVLDLCWSKKEQFLLSASMDHTVRLWHISMDQCLRVFKHTDFITSIDFHPIDDRYFISGSIDGKVRVWNIPEYRETDWSDVHDMVTAISFSKDGRRAVVGTMKGKCRFYSCDNNFKLEYEAQIDVKDKRGKQSRSKKITGLQFLPGDPSKLLITSNDSRLRLYEGYILQCKFKGLHNRNTQIKATFSNEGQYIVCGSDDGQVYLWSTCNAASASSAEKGAAAMCVSKDKIASYECFQAFEDIVTVAIFAPESSRRQIATTPTEQNGKDAIRISSVWRSLSHESPEALAAAESVMTSSRHLGSVILAAGYGGDIKIFENSGRPQWV